jgi:uroporphyrin-III C-methyltransferase
MGVAATLDFTGQRVLVAGAGAKAAHWVRQLLENGAHVFVVAPCVAPAFEPLLPRVHGFQRREVEERDFEGISWVSVATENVESDRRIGELTRDRGLWLHAPDLPEMSSIQLGLTSTVSESFRAGTVVIAGAGPGSLGLLTLRALDRLQNADVVLHDALVDEAVLGQIQPSARVINVGRRAQGFATEGSNAFPQSLTHRLMIENARAQRRVLRLHAGDPIIFGRGGEEMQALDDADVAYELVPGVSAISAVPAAAHIPLTQRNIARGFSVRTGHTQEGYTAAELPPSEETVVVLMGLGAVEEILRNLEAEGRDPNTPAIAVASASTDQQKVVCGTLRTLALKIREEQLSPPATLIVGEVARKALLSGMVGVEAA